MILRKMIKAFLVILLLVGIISCAGKTTESEIVSIEVDAEMIIADFDLDDFELSQIEITLEYSDGTSSKIPLTALMLSSADLAKLDIIGTHTIAVNYEGLSTSFTITLVYQEVKMKMYLIYQLAVQSSATTLTFDEWVDTIKGEDGVGIVDASIDGYGHLILLLSNDEEIDVGQVIGRDGREIIFRITFESLQWQYEGDTIWQDLLDISELEGESGLGIESIEINEFGELVITYTDATVINVGTLYRQYLVQFKDIDGKVIDTQMVKREESAIAPEGPMIEGYIFTGWDKDYTYIISDLVVNAQYSPLTFTVNFETGTDESLESIDNIYYYDSITLPIPNQNGYVFLGWFLSLEVNSMQFFDQTPITEDITLYAKWTLADYVVTFLDYDSSILKVEYVTHNSSAAAPPDPVRLGYVFTGWNTAFVQVTSDLTITATYTIGLYDIIFEMQDGDFVPSIIDVTYGSTVTLPIPERQDYDFVGWEYYGGFFTDETPMPPHDLVLTAVWTDHIYYLNFDSNTGNPVDAYRVIRYAEITDLPTPTKPNAVFEGWMFNDEVINMPFIYEFGEDITITAKWSITVNYVDYLYMDGYAIIAGYGGSYTNLDLPDSIEALPITIINDQVFMNKSLLANVSLGEYVTNVGSEAFKNCTSLSNIYFPTSAIYFGEAVLYGTNNLATITLSPVQPNELKFFFGGNIADVPASLTKITFAPGTTSINKTLLQGELLGITIQTASDLVSIPNDYFRDCTSLTSVILNSGITSIGTYAFVNTNLVSIIIPETVNQINYRAFFELTSLTTVEFAESSILTSIGVGAFYNATNLTEITLPASLTQISSNAFSGCTSLSAVYLPEDNQLQTIGSYAFSNDVLLDYFTYAPNLTSVGQFAFYNCDELEIFVIPSNVTYVGTSAFALCYDLVIFAAVDSQPVEWSSGINPSGRPIYWGFESFYEDEDFKYILFNNGQAGVFRLQEGNLDTNLVFPAIVNGYSVTKTIARSFIDNTNIQTLTIPYTIHEIGQYSFSGNSALTAVNFSGSSNLKTIGMYAFHNATSLDTFVFPAGLEEIGVLAFRLTAFTSITIPASVHTIGNGAFEHCSSNTEVIFEEGSVLTTIGGYAFIGNRFEYIELPETLTYIGNFAFSSNSAFASIVIPASVTYVGLKTFSYCYNLNIYIQALEVPVDWNIDWNFDGLPVEFGVNNLGYTDDFKYVELADYTVAILYVSNKLATQLVIPSQFGDGNITVSQISRGAFRSMPNLTDLSLPFVGAYPGATGKEGLFGYIFGTYLYTGATGRSQYYNATEFSYNYIPNSLNNIFITNAETISYGAFYNCASLTNIFLNAGITYVGENAFKGCASLVIYSYEASEPPGWDLLWNPDGNNVIWGYTA